MALQILLGASGVGKSHVVYEWLIASAMKNPRRRHIVLVPEQFTMQTQRKLVTMHPEHGIMNIDVLSFERLAYRVFAELDLEEYAILDDAGKSMLLRKVTGERKKELGIFQKNLTKAGFISRLKSMLSELYQYGITGEDLARLAEQTEGHPILQQKLRDLEVFYQAFSENMESHTIPAEELPAILLRKLPESEFLQGAMIVLDGFTGFTPIQYQIIARMLKQALAVSIPLTVAAGESLEPPVSEHQLFAVTKRTVERLSRIAEEGGQKAEVYWLTEPPACRMGNPALVFLERHFLRFGSQEKYPKVPEGISLTLARTPKEEVECAADEILRLVREQGWRYREIAVVTGDLEGYRPFLEREFTRAEIPFFMDKKKGLMGNPLVAFMRSALEAVEKGMTYDTVFRYLKTGMTGLPRAGVDLLDNYVSATGKRGFTQWQTEWTHTYRGQEDLDLEEINRLREQTVQPLLRLREAILKKPKKVRNATAGLRELIDAGGVGEKLQVKAMEFEEAGDYIRAEEYARVQECVLLFLEQMDHLLGEEALSIPELGDVLDAGLEEARIGSIPPCLDQVQVGDIQRSRLTDIRALLFLGLNDGIVPKAETSGGVLSDEEREILETLQIELAPTAKKNAYMERFYLYTLFAKPSAVLYLSCSKMSGDGGALRPSYVIAQVQRLFPAISVREIRAEDRPRIYSLPTAREAVAKAAAYVRERGAEPWWKELYGLLRRLPGEEKRLETILDACFRIYKENSLSRAAAKALYGDTLAGSVTRLEKYAACAYAQFLTYGLKLTERVTYEFRSMDRGNFFHKALETFFRELKEKGIAPAQVTEQQRKEFVERSIAAAVEAAGGSILSSSARLSYYVNRWAQMTDRTICAICDQMKEGDFHPEEVELKFDGSRSAAMNLILNDEEKMVLKGVIDRLDICEDGNQIYVKIVDYKTGQTSLDLSDVYYGLQMQLVLYLDAVMEIYQRKYPEKEIVPAGIYYYHIQDPFVEDSGSLSPEQLEEKRKRELRMKGLTNESQKVAVHLEAVGGQKISAERFEGLRRHVQHRVREFGERILAGEIEVAPYRRKKDSACDYCAFHAICGFDPKIPGYHFRRLKEQTPEEIWERIEGKEASHGDYLDEGAAGNH